MTEPYIGRVALYRGDLPETYLICKIIGRTEGRDYVEVLETCAVVGCEPHAFKDQHGRLFLENWRRIAFIPDGKIDTVRHICANRIQADMCAHSYYLGMVNRHADKMIREIEEVCHAADA